MPKAEFRATQANKINNAPRFPEFDRPMRILIVSGYFPPYSVIGAQRVQGLARYLVNRGHDVRVLTAGGYNLPRTLKSPLDSRDVVEVKFLDINAPIEWVRRWLARGAVGAQADGGAAMAAPLQDGIAYRLASVWRSLTNVPDGHVAWIPVATWAGKKLLRDWQPDVILASALPFSTAVVAARLARLANCPWAVEFRDLWYGNPYQPRSVWRRALDRFIERKVMRTAGWIFTVSEPLARELRARYPQTVEVVTNGFDPVEFPSSGGRGNPNLEILSIFYGGTIYPGKRDPLPLFQALASLGDRRHRVRIIFAGQDLRGVITAAREAGVEECVHIAPFKSRVEIIASMLVSDVNLLLLWNDPREEGVYSGKLFEYIGARRPILMLGYDQGVAADLIHKLDCGFVSNAPALIANQIQRWMVEKERVGWIAAFEHPDRLLYTTDNQFAIQEESLRVLVAQRRRS
jgi:glycosyltransferase involved in cell wall biosynthesis